MAGRRDDEKESIMTMAGILLAMFVVLTALIWLFGSNGIVFYWAPKFEWLSGLWQWLPWGDAARARIDAAYAVFMRSPKDVGFFEWVSWVNLCLRPLTILLAFGLFLFWFYAVLTPTADVRRQLGSGELLERMSHVFTGTAPVIHLRKVLVDQSDPLWARQTFPEEVLLKTKVNGKPLVSDGQMVVERAREYFRGLVLGKSRQPKKVDGRLESRMLGRQVVHLPVDRKSGVCFEDRFSDVGKILFGLLVAKSFGGKEGKADYEKARDQLNNSARGAKHGMANLKVAQWIYTKYRGNEQARRLFAVHHWEYSYLYRLLHVAKRRGKCGHWEFLWLKPMNRILFYALNTVGRDTPHTESAAVFNHAVYENMCGKLKRLPYTLVGDKGKPEIVPFIYVEGAVKGLGAEWARWQDAIVDDDDWWTDESVWKVLEGVNWGQYEVPSDADYIETPEFDAPQAIARQESQKAYEARVRGEASMGAEFDMGSV